MNTIQILFPTEREIYILCTLYQKSFLTPQFKSRCLNLGGCWFPAFITICVSLGVRCSAPPPGGTYTNEDTTSNEHPPPSVLNYSAVPLPEPTQSCCKKEKKKRKKKRKGSSRKHRAPQTSSSPRAEMEDTCPCPQWRRAVLARVLQRGCVCLFV